MKRRLVRRKDRRPLEIYCDGCNTFVLRTEYWEDQTRFMHGLLVAGVFCSRECYTLWLLRQRIVQ